MAFIGPGVVYRRDEDATHSSMFSLNRVLSVDEHVTMAHLKGVLAEFAERFFGPGTPIRLRPSYFPFVEPGAGSTSNCPFCKQPDGTQKPAACARRRSIGNGMQDDSPRHAKLQAGPERWTGFAFGMRSGAFAMNHLWHPP